MPNKTIIVFFNLKKEVNESDYLNWAKQIDLPTVNQLQSVTSFNVYKGLNLFGSNEQTPFQYFEIINVASEAEFLADVATEKMQKVVAQFQNFVEDAHFIVTENIA